MNWILLILAGCLELVFTFFLPGKDKQGIRNGKICVVIRTLGILMCEYVASDKGDQDIAGWYGLCDMDRHRCGGHGINRYFLL